MGIPYRLGELVTFQRGFDITKAEQQPGSVPIVSSSGVSSFHNKYRVKAPGVVIGRKGTLGTTHFLRENFWPHDTSLWVRDFKDNDPRFVYYFLQTLKLEQFDVGASNPTLNRNHLHKIPVTPFEYRQQRKIAAILTAYDDLIDNNRQRIALLEKMAEEIYREWFVRLRFPGHEHTPVHKGVPEGWTEEYLADAFKFTGGGTPSKEQSRFWDGGEVNWYTPSDITASEGIFLSASGTRCTEEGVRSSSARMFPEYSIMLTSRATIGAIGINTTRACTNQGFISCMPNERFPLVFLYHWLRLAKSHFEMLSSGATFAELTKGTFKKIKILRPTSALVGAYEDQGQPIFKLIENLQGQIQEATKTRNLLLNRLISGKLRVDDLEIQFPPSMREEVGNEGAESRNSPAA